jgi:cytoskeleton protein RodZ
MTDEAVASDRASDAAAVVKQPESAGALLRRMRESSGVHLAVLASMMKVTPQKLDALEHDRLDQLPDVTFARGLAASICRAFGVDPRPILERMPKITQGLHEPQGAGAGETFRRPGDDPAPLLSSGHSRVVLGVVVVLLLAAGLVWIWPTLPINLTATPATVSPTVTTTPANPVVPNGAKAGATDVAAAGAGKTDVAVNTAVPAQGVGSEGKTQASPADGSAPAETHPAQTPPAASATPAGVAEAAVNPSPADSAAAAKPAAETANPSSTASPLVLEASGESWVEVKDATGKSLVNRTLKAGDKLDLNGALPFSVVIGRKGAVQATVHGEPFDLAAQGRGTVARFQVK